MVLVRNKWTTYVKPLTFYLASLQVLNKLYLFLLYCYFIFIIVLCHASILSSYTKGDIYSLYRILNLCIFLHLSRFSTGTWNFQQKQWVCQLCASPVAVEDAKEDRILCSGDSFSLFRKTYTTLPRVCFFLYLLLQGSIVSITWS